MFVESLIISRGWVMMQPSDLEVLKAIYYKVREYLNYSEMSEMEDLINKLRKEVVR